MGRICRRDLSGMVCDQPSSAGLSRCFRRIKVIRSCLSQLTGLGLLIGTTLSCVGGCRSCQTVGLTRFCVCVSGTRHLTRRFLGLMCVTSETYGGHNGTETRQGYR